MRYLLLTLLAFAAGCTGCASVPSDSGPRATALRLVSINGKDGQLCSGTAISADTLLTAKHCVNGFRLSSVNGQPVAVTSTTYIGADEARITLTKPMFTHWARIGAAPRQGDRLRWWGNPKGLPFVYRQGYVAVIQKGAVAVDAMVCHGDSGSGLFNDHGEMVGVLVAMLPEQINCAFAVGQL